MEDLVRGTQKSLKIKGIVIAAIDTAIVAIGIVIVAIDTAIVAIDTATVAMFTDFLVIVCLLNASCKSVVIVTRYFYYR
jgi:hypothetical protein